MSDYQIISKEPVILKHKEQSFNVDFETQKKIDEFWKKKISTNPKLFDEPVLCLVTINEKEIPNVAEVCYVNYKTILASKEISSLNLEFEQIGVSGIIIVQENNEQQILFSRRSLNTTEYPGYLELVPSGHIDKTSLQSDGIVNYNKKIIEEFIEETNLPSEVISRIEPLCFVKDNIHNVYDICSILHLTTNHETILTAFETVTEYESPILISISELEKFIKINEKNILPTSKAIVECFLNRN